MSYSMHFIIYLHITDSLRKKICDLINTKRGGPGENPFIENPLLLLETQ